MPHRKVSQLTDPELEELAAAKIYPPAEWWYESRFIVGYVIDNGGGWVFDADLNGVVKLFTLAEIKLAPYVLYTFIDVKVPFEDISKGAANKVVMPYQIAQSYGVV